MYYDIFEQILFEVTETYDQFIFDTICPWLQEKTQLIVDKQLLIAALAEYRERHPLKFVAVATSRTDDCVDGGEEDEE